MPGYGSGLYGTELYGDEPSVTLPVRELPPLRQSIEAITPNGRYYRWSEDEPNPANVPSGLRHSSTMPGGYETCDVTLPRKSGIDYADLDRLTTVRIRDAGGDIIGEYRLERAPRISGDQMAISPSAVGWQAHLEDNKSAREIYIDRDLSNWSEPSIQRRLILAGLGISQQSTSITRDDSTSLPALAAEFTGPWDAAGTPYVEVMYSSAGLPIGYIYYEWSKGGNVTLPDANWTWKVYLGTDSTFATVDSSAELQGAGPGTGATLSATDTNRVNAMLQFGYKTAGGGDSRTYGLYWKQPTVYGNRTITRRGDWPGGFYASDIVADAVSRWAPLLTVRAGDTVLQSSFVIEQAAFRDSTTVGEIVRQVSRFELPYWAVWDNREFHWDPARTPRKRWRARIAPAQLEETGPQLDRLWESVIVQRQDVDGSTRTTGPPGSGADTEDAVLKDDDPDNPANQLGIVRRDLLVMGVGTAASATELGRRFLEQAKLLDTSGRARIVGHIIDDHGIVFPYTSVRAGDTITFVDANDTSERRIVRADHDRATRSCSVDLDAPPDGLSALLERLGVVLVPLGL